MVVRHAALVFMIAAGVAVAQVAVAGPVVNYVTDGSFENGFTGWTVGVGSGASNPGSGPQVVVTNGTTAGPYGDKEAADNAASPSPDPAGSHAAYLVDDTATETLTETLNLQPGIYEVGFDLLATGSGAHNKYDSQFSAVIAGVNVTTASVSQIIATQGADSWAHYSANADIVSAGNYTVAFTFQGGAAPAKDVMIDRVYVQTPTTLGTPPVVIPVPEPAGAAALAAGLMALAATLRGRWRA